ncbi:MAG: ProQ/FinO family protein [Rhodocyclaceae bacterium]|jgi:ProP effector|nr:ProQ/FinO family protein [Rhodocyclaceae bacterium]
MNTPTSQPPRPPRQPDPVLATLASSFAVFRAGQPLAIGIHKAIRERLPDIGEAALRASLKAYTASTKYLKAIANSQQRFDLDGQPAGEVTAEQRQQAQDTLKERFRKAAERKQAEQAAKERQEKLQKLAEKFARH